MARSPSYSGHPVVIYLLVCPRVCTCVCVCANVRLNMVNGDPERDRGRSPNKSSFFSIRESLIETPKVPEDVFDTNPACYMAWMHVHAHTVNLTEMTRTSYAHEKDFLHASRFAARRAVCSLCDLHRLSFAVLRDRITLWRKSHVKRDFHGWRKKEKRKKVATPEETWIINSLSIIPICLVSCCVQSLTNYRFMFFLCCTFLTWWKYFLHCSSNVRAICNRRVTHCLPTVFHLTPIGLTILHAYLIISLRAISIGPPILAPSARGRPSAPLWKSTVHPDTRIFYLQPRPHRRTAALRSRRWTPFQGPWTIPRYRDRSSSYPARWNPSRGGTSRYHLSSHLPRIRDRPPLAEAHGDPFQGEELVPLRKHFIARDESQIAIAVQTATNLAAKWQLFLT